MTASTVPDIEDSGETVWSVLQIRTPSMAVVKSGRTHAVQHFAKLVQRHVTIAPQKLAVIASGARGLRKELASFVKASV
jgi:23S rRNA pseudoU1915 N3-methylase RlmH